MRTIDDLTLARLTVFRSWLSREPRNKPSTGGRRGRKVATDAHRKPGAVNVEFRAVRTVLGYLRRLGLLHLSNDALSDGLFEHALNEIVEEHLDLSVFDKRYANDETGRLAYDPRILLKVVLYGYYKGLISSRRLGEACRNSLRVIFV